MDAILEIAIACDCLSCHSQAMSDIIGHIRSCFSATVSHQTRSDCFIVQKGIESIEQTYCTRFLQNTTLFRRIRKRSKSANRCFDFYVGFHTLIMDFLYISITHDIYDHTRHDRIDHSPLRSSSPPTDRRRQGDSLRYHHPRQCEQGTPLSLRSHICMTREDMKKWRRNKNRPE